MVSQPEAILGIILPHPLGKLCLQMRLLRAARDSLPAAARLWAFTSPAYRSGIERMGIFERVALYEDTLDRSIGVLVDLTSYEYSYATAARQDCEVLVRRDLEEPWKIDVVSRSGRTTHVCPALQPETGWFASDGHASAMLCELPLLNLGLGRPISDRGLLEQAQGPLRSQPRSGANGPDILFLMGGTSRAKHFPLPEWRVLRKGLLRAGRPVVTVTGPDELWLLDELAASGMPYVVSTDLGDLMDRILESTAVVANDCGPMHVALMLGHPTLGIFGPTVPEAWFCPTQLGQICLQTEQARGRRSDLVCGGTWAAWPRASEVSQHLDALLRKAPPCHPAIRYLS